MGLSVYYKISIQKRLINHKTIAQNTNMICWQIIMKQKKKGEK